MKRALLTVISPGLATLVVDAGRPRTRGLGVPVGGPADAFSFALGNLLAGNPPDAAALEIALAGPTLVTDAPLGCAICGAPFDVRTDRRDIAPNASFTLEPGEILRIGGTPTGARAYLCIRGGIDAPLILGSRTALAPLKAGDVIAAAAGRIGGRRLDPTPQPPIRFGEGAGDGVAERGPGVEVIRLLPAAQTSWFPERVLKGKAFRVGPASDRMGMRLVGEALPMPPREIVSEPVCPGTVQVSRDGQCILLGVDGQTIGGYPKIAQAIRARPPRPGPATARRRGGLRLRLPRRGRGGGAGAGRDPAAVARRSGGLLIESPPDIRNPR